MITFNNFRLTPDGRAINITIPRGSAVYVNQDFDLTTQFQGELLYENFPIHHAQKSFRQKILCEIKLGEMLNPKGTLAKNMQTIAKKYDSYCIWDIPLKYFNISQDLWKTKVQKLDEAVLFQAECGISMLNTHDVCYFRNIKIPSIEERQKERFLGIINAKITHGNGIVIYSGENLALDHEIKIIL